jgi:3-oxoacyl-[acyl-carrier protein] reductase
VTGRLRSKAAVITGAGHGIGAATARLFAAEGASLCLNDRDETALRALADELRATGSVAVTLAADISDPHTPQRLVNECLRAYGRIDVLVNNAGIISYRTIDELTDQDWHETLAVDLTATFLCTRAAVAPMITRRSGRIVNVSSQLALRGGAGFSAYCAAKAGILGFTKAVAREVAPYGITVNAVAPGPVDTDMLSLDGNSWSDDDIDKLPMRRIGRPDEVAPTILFLACEPDGNLFTGQTLGPNSGDVMP